MSEAQKFATYIIRYRHDTMFIFDVLIFSSFFVHLRRTLSFVFLTLLACTEYILVHSELAELVSINNA